MQRIHRTSLGMIHDLLMQKPGEGEGLIYMNKGDQYSHLLQSFSLTWTSFAHPRSRVHLMASVIMHVTMLCNIVRYSEACCLFVVELLPDHRSSARIRYLPGPLKHPAKVIVIHSYEWCLQHSIQPSLGQADPFYSWSPKKVILQDCVHELKGTANSFRFCPFDICIC